MEMDGPPIRISGWGPFRLPGERARRRRAVQSAEDRETLLRAVFEAPPAERSTRGESDPRPDMSKGASASTSDLSTDEPNAPQATSTSRRILGEVSNAGEATEKGARAGENPEVRDEAALRSTLQARQELLGADHPGTVSARLALADFLAGQGSDANAEVEYRRVIKDRVRQFGDSHPETLIARYGLAVVLANQRKFGEAEDEFRAIAVARAHQLGENHPETLAARRGLAVVLANQRKDADAQAEFRQVRAAYTRADNEVAPDPTQRPNETHSDESSSRQRNSRKRVYNTWP